MSKKRYIMYTALALVVALVGVGILYILGLFATAAFFSFVIREDPGPTPTPYRLPLVYSEPPQWLPNGEGIVLSHDRRIYLVGLDGTERRLDEGDAEFHNSMMISVHPNSSYVAYFSNSNLGGDAYQTWFAELYPDSKKHHLDNREFFSRNDMPDNLPAWSPDGTRMAFFHDSILRTGQTSDIPSNVDDLRGSTIDYNLSLRFHRKGIAFCTGFCRDLVWSPDGRHLAFTGEQAYRRRVSSEEEREWTEAEKALQRATNRISLADSYGNRFLQLDIAGGHAPAWSPDGERLAFAGWGTDTLPYIYTVNADGSDLHAVHGIPSRPDSVEGDAFYYRHSVDSYGVLVTAMSWSPEGSTILYTLHNDGYESIAGVDRLHFIDINAMDGPRYWSLEPEFGVHAGVWSPDGSRIAVYTKADGEMRLYTIAPDGSDLRWLARGG